MIREGRSEVPLLLRLWHIGEAATSRLPSRWPEPAAQQNINHFNESVTHCRVNYIPDISSFAYIFFQLPLHWLKYSCCTTLRRRTCRHRWINQRAWLHNFVYISSSNLSEPPHANMTFLPADTTVLSAHHSTSMLNTMTVSALHYFSVTATDLHILFVVNRIHHYNFLSLMHFTIFKNIEQKYVRQTDTYTDTGSPYVNPDKDLESNRRIHPSLYSLPSTGQYASWSSSFTQNCEYIYFIIL